MVERLTKPLIQRIATRIIHPVIVETQAGRLAEIVEELKPYSFTFIRPILDRLAPSEVPFFFPRFMTIPRFNMLAAILPREVVEDYAEDKRIVKIYPDNIVYALQYPTVPDEGVFVAERRIREKKRIQFTSTYWTKKLIGCDVANSKGFFGEGIRVAVLDTGSSSTHEQLRGKIEYPPHSVYPAATFDLNGHGSWCATCIAGDSTVDAALSRLSSKVVRCEGMAPFATIIPIKVLDFVVGMGSDSSIIKGVELALEADAEVLSLSLGSSEQATSEDENPHFKVFEEARRNNIIACVAAGNEGPNPQTIGSPGSLSNVLTVGAYDPITGEVAEYSSRGPTPWGSIKPDVIAPGGGYPQNGIDSGIVNMLDMSGDGVENRYSPIQGTSMATPHCSGLVALMRECHRKILGRILTLDEILRMMASLGHTKNNDDGFGLISWKLYEEWLATEYSIRI